MEILGYFFLRLVLIVNEEVVKWFGLVIVFCSLMACNSKTSIDKTVDSTSKAIDSQKYKTRDSVVHKAGSNKQIIDSTFKVLQDSMNKTK